MPKHQWYVQNLGQGYRHLPRMPRNTDPRLLVEHELVEPEHTDGMEPTYRRSEHRVHELDGNFAVLIACRRWK